MAGVVCLLVLVGAVIAVVLFGAKDPRENPPLGPTRERDKK